jgi:hypothetical protein
MEMPIQKILGIDNALFFSTFSNLYYCPNVDQVYYGKRLTIHSIGVDFAKINDFLVFDDSIHIASIDGVTIIPVKDLLEPGTPPPIPIIQKILLNDKELDLPVNAINYRGVNKIIINFNSICYSTKSVQFAYIVKGLDKNWKYGFGSSMNIALQSLPIGEYYFFLKVKKASSDWSEPIQIKISIKPTYYQNPLFWIGLAVLTIIIALISSYWIRKIRMKKIEMDNQLIMLEQRALQSMMNPHFVFNSLGSIQNYLLKNRAGEAIIYLTQFARLIRQNLNAINLTMISLDEEVERLKNYLELEQIRLENQFDYFIDIDAELKDELFFIPSMIVQPFVENSIWHGITSINSKGIVRVKFNYLTDKMVKIIVEDNGIGYIPSESNKRKKKGHLQLSMLMTGQRIALLSKKYSVDARIEYTALSSESDNPGTRVTIYIPLAVECSDEKLIDYSKKSQYITFQKEN